MRTEKRSEPAVPGRGLARALAVAACTAALGGCSGWDYATGASYGGSTAVSGSGGAAAATDAIIAGGSGLYVGISLSTTAANVMAAATGVAIYAAMLQESGEWRPWWGPPMLEGRAVSEQDCTKPIADSQANLKCE